MGLHKSIVAADLPDPLKYALSVIHCHPRFHHTHTHTHMRRAQVAIQLPGRQQQQQPPTADDDGVQSPRYTVENLAGYFVPCPEDTSLSTEGHSCSDRVERDSDAQRGRATAADPASSHTSPLTSVRETRVWAQDCILRSARRIRDVARRGGSQGVSHSSSKGRKRRLDTDGDYVPPEDSDNTPGSSDGEYSAYEDDNTGENPQQASGAVSGACRRGEAGKSDGGGGSSGCEESDCSDISAASDNSSCSFAARRRTQKRGRWGGRVAVRAGAPGSRCFLCDYCTSLEVRFVTTFISDNIANMDVGLMAEQIRKYVFDKRPEYSEGNHGLEVATIKNHIRQHMLSPTVRIADMMRHLLKLCDTLRSGLECVDPDTGESSADKSNIDTYLKVVTKVLDMYKMSETNKMLFASTEK